MPKFLCLIDSLSPGGAERQMSYLTTGLKKFGADVRLVVFSVGNDFYEKYITSHGVRVDYNIKGVNPIRRVLEIVKLVRTFKPDAVIAYKDGVTMAACLAKLIYHFKLIVSERNTTQSLSLYERLKFNLYRFANIIVPNSHSQAEFIRNHYSHLTSKVRVITNSIDLEKFEPVPREGEKNKLKILITGRLMPQKNVINFLKAVKILKGQGVTNVEINWFGNHIGGSYTSEILSLYKDMGLEDIFHIHAATKNIESIYSLADIFCLPSVYEGFPNVLCEAMACGLPVCAGNVCDNPLIVEEGVNGFLFDPHIPQDIAHTLQKLIELSDNERKHMGTLNRQKIEKLCARDTFINKYLSLLG